MAQGSRRKAKEKRDRITWRKVQLTMDNRQRTNVRDSSHPGRRIQLYRHREKHIKCVPDCALLLIRRQFNPAFPVKYHCCPIPAIWLPFAEAFTARITGADKGKTGVLHLP